MLPRRKGAPVPLLRGGGPAIRILLDCTETSASHAQTGIQRVVRSMVGAALSIPQPGIQFVPVAFNGRHFAELDTRAVSKMLAPRAPGVSPHGLLRQLVAGTSRLAPLRVSLAHPRLLGVGREVANFARWRFRHLHPSRGSALRSIEYARGDWIVLLDSNWGPDLGPELQRAKSCGARICVVVYDLIKIHTPEITPPGAAPIYSRWMIRTLPLADRVLAISRAVREDFLRYQEARGLPRMPDACVGAFHLGSDFGRDELKRRQEFRPKWFDPESAIFLALGTIEPRKSQTTILDAFEQRWADGDTARLVLVGREGWGSHDLVTRLRRHRELERRLFWLRDASDAELETCFQHATALINMSTSEGFGLPIVEALYRGVPVIAADIPVFREIGESFTTFVPAGDVNALVRAIAAAEDPRAPRPTPGMVHLATWDDSLRDLVAFLNQEPSIGVATAHDPHQR